LLLNYITDNVKSTNIEIAPKKLESFKKSCEWLKKRNLNSIDYKDESTSKACTKTIQN